MDAVTLLRQQLQNAHGYLEATMEDVKPAQLQWIPPGKAHSIGATYAHIVQAEDNIVNGLLQQSAPLMMTSWAGKTGFSAPMPQPGTQDWSGYDAWTSSVQVDLPAARAYARAVYANSDAYLASLTPEALDTPMDLTALGFGDVTLAWMLDRLIVGHADNICGEISCLKGLQGAKGYAE